MVWVLHKLVALGAHLSKSSKDSTPSPDDKRIRKEFDSVSSQTNDEVIEALDMAEDLGKNI